MTSPISVRVSDKLVHELEDIASETERSRAFHIQKALETYVEDYADLQIALDRLHDQADDVVSGKELRKSVGL